MQTCETRAENGSLVKRVTVRSGGVGHAHSGVIKKCYSSDGILVEVTSAEDCKPSNTIIVKLGG